MTARLATWAGALLALAAAPAQASTGAATLTLQGGTWVKLFATDVERALGYSVRIDTASIVTTATARSFREAEVMLRARGAYPAGSTLVLQRSVDCTGGRVRTQQWQVLGPTGTVLGTSTSAGSIARIAWDTPDGKVLRYVCSGVLPR